MIISVDPAAAKPPYEQVKDQIDGLIRRGELAQGTRLPTVRQLAAEVGVAVNTAARAYKELEAERMIETRGRNGTFVLASRSHTNDAGTRSAATAFVHAAREAGISLPEAMEILRQAW
ncbi:GntR family transcriptional regulator [Kribbella sp. NPDC051587]|uniref:GntR family transcriptional regulator n=1 Tax=Kribbella sp. NPDC051587 TaxID=3364119 RepID=UPI003790B88F